NRESVEVYWNSPKGAINLSQLDAKNAAAKAGTTGVVQNSGPTDFQQRLGERSQMKRNVLPHQQGAVSQAKGQREDVQQYSKLTTSEAEFRQLIGDASEGTLARFLQNRLKVLFWYRSPRDPQVVFGAQLNLERLLKDLRELVKIGPNLAQEICVALIDDAGKPVALSQGAFKADWRRPFIATEIGEWLPHWEVAVYLLNPAKLTRAAQTL